MQAFLSTFFGNPLLVLSTIMVLILIILMVCILTLHKRIKRLLGGATAKSIDESVAALRAEVKEIAQFKKDMQEYLTTVEKRVRKSVQSVETIRFNPYKGDGSGGNQSFATAFLTEKGNGVVLSSLYARDHVSIFSKPLQNGKPVFELSEEEQQALELAQKSLKA